MALRLLSFIVIASFLGNHHVGDREKGIGQVETSPSLLFIPRLGHFNEIKASQIIPSLWWLTFRVLEKLILTIFASFLFFFFLEERIFWLSIINWWVISPFGCSVINQFYVQRISLVLVCGRHRGLRKAGVRGMSWEFCGQQATDDGNLHWGGSSGDTTQTVQMCRMITACQVLCSVLCFLFCTSLYLF